MRKKLLKTINVLLGAVSVMLAGCHTQKNATPAVEPEEQPRELRNREVICMYGAPSYFEEQKAKNDSTQQESEQQQVRENENDSTSNTDRPGRVMVKYGIPPLMK